MFLVWILPGAHLQSGPTASRSQLVSQKSALERKLKALERKLKSWEDRILSPLVYFQLVEVRSGDVQ